jgi:HD-GYP domain-containing protein (c-di-GMP phosphodiesterase class II)
LVASLVFVALHGGPGLDGSMAFFIGAAVAFLTYWIVNTWLVIIGASLLYGGSPYRFWQKNFRWAFGYELMAAPVTLAVAYAYQELWIIGLLLLTLPILMVRLAYSQYLELKKTYRETVRTLVKIIEMHDPYTAGHSDRVATYSRQLCDVLRLTPRLTERIELAAYLHDLGKIHLDLSSVIRKAGKLNEDERRLIKLHSVVSADLANQVSYFKGEIEAMIRHHHENWDGTGYPHGLKEEQIPLGSRIILLADAFDAMTTSRVYRDALDLGRVKEEFRRFAGIQFDPSLVPVFLDQVIGDGSGIVRQPINEPLEGQRARLEASGAPTIRELKSRMIG